MPEHASEPSGGGAASATSAVGAPSLARWPFRVVGVTGTNGKTTTATMIDAIAARAGEASGRITTVGAWVRGERVAEETTLEATRAALDLAASSGVRAMIVETTSYALSRGFARDLPPTIAVFTNLSRDHLDYHGTPEHYLAAKAQLFMALLPGGVAVLDAADASSALLAEVTPTSATIATYAARPLDPACHALPTPALLATKVTARRDGTTIALAPSPFADRLGGELTLAVVGEVHAENALAAAVAADAMGCSPQAIKAALTSFRGVPGRFEIVTGGDRASGPLVVVDYAHTPDALERTLVLARRLVTTDRPREGRVIVVFGCGGDRDAGKRPEMGRVASRLADVIIVTTDNPRSEDPAVIADQIFSGIEGSSRERARIADRARAIRRAIAIAEAGDAVVIAGKGHERTQQLRDRVVPFDDVQVARSATRAAGR